MTTKNNRRILLIVVCVVVVLAALWWFCSSKKPEPKIREGFLAAGAMDHLGTAVPDGITGEYELVNSGGTVFPSLDSNLRSTDFAELVNAGDHAQQVQAAEETRRPLERLKDLSESYFPTVASKSMPFSQASSKPLVHSFSVNLPRINLKGKLYEMNLSEAVRGTLPINYDPNVSMIAMSQYRTEDSFNTGMMTTAFNSLYGKLTGSHRNLPLYIAGAGSAVGIGGMPVEAIYDA